MPYPSPDLPRPRHSVKTRQDQRRHHHYHQTMQANPPRQRAVHGGHNAYVHTSSRACVSLAAFSCALHTASSSRMRSFRRRYSGVSCSMPLPLPPPPPLAWLRLPLPSCRVVDKPIVFTSRRIRQRQSKGLMFEKAQRVRFMRRFARRLFSYYTAVEMNRGMRCRCVF